jgi:hypothetical protein
MLKRFNRIGAMFVQILLFECQRNSSGCENPLSELHLDSDLTAGRPFFRTPKASEELRCGQILGHIIVNKRQTSCWRCLR